MKITYNKDVDALYIEILEDIAIDSEEIKKDVIVDYNKKDKIVGIEILNCLKENKNYILPAVKEIEKLAA